MSDKAIEYFIKLCNTKGLKEGFTAIVVSNLIKDKSIYKPFYDVYYQLTSKRGKHKTFKEEVCE